MPSCRRSYPIVAPIAACTAPGNNGAVACDWAAFVTGSHALLEAALFIETGLLVNAVGHSSTARLLGSYVPALITAVVINLPVAIYVLQRAYASHGFVLSRPWQLIGEAIARHLTWHNSVYWRADEFMPLCLP